MSNKDVRWIQRFENYKKALEYLQQASENYKEGEMDVVEKVGMIKFFEMTYELAWNTIKDYYEDQGESNIQGSKDAIQIAYSRGLIKDGDDWFDMVDSRKLSVHTYNEGTADKIAKEIVGTYIDLFIQLQTRLEMERQS